jgi:hypothetical protein
MQAQSGQRISEMVKDAGSLADKQHATIQGGINRHKTIFDATGGLPQSVISDSETIGHDYASRATKMIDHNDSADRDKRCQAPCHAPMVTYCAAGVA